MRVLERVPGARAVYHAAGRVQQHARFVGEYRRYKTLDDRRFQVRWGDRWAWMNDRKPLTIDPHYLYHPAWAARVLAETRPAKHVDIASRLEWATIASAFVPIDYYELRPPQIARLAGFEMLPGDLLALPFADEAVESLSCMHTIEHVGLGRYGDAMDPEGDVKACLELARVLAPGGTLLFAAPVGAPRIEFNGQRVYSHQMALGLFPGLTLREFMLSRGPADDLLYGDDAVAAVPPEGYGCGCYRFEKPRVSDTSPS